MKIQIKPVQIFPNTATQIEFLPAEITFGVSARSQYILQTQNGVNLMSEWVSMTPEQYAQWGNNDDFAAKCFLENLGVEPATPIEAQLSDAVSTQRGDIATYEAEKAAAQAAKAASEAAQAAAKAAADAAEAENQRVKAAQAEAAQLEAAARQKAEFDAAVAAKVAELAP